MHTVVIRLLVLSDSDETAQKILELATKFDGRYDRVPARFFQLCDRHYVEIAYKDKGHYRDVHKAVLELGVPPNRRQVTVEHVPLMNAAPRASLERDRTEQQ